ncbi:UNVERIFIED_CONTAM: hypothetical protein Sradi_5845800 [Sesamum radiatum]|uniref:Uncharacterized protein n=1 Tax=Sesamum radiatum TaxID=300843 RepID=A0AAW2KQ28_SESRA
MHRMKELYAGPQWHIRYAATKAFFGMIMIKGPSVREHGVLMLSLVEKLKDLQVDFKEEETYNMNGLQENLHELINILVKYEATIEKSALSVLVGDASTSKAKGKVAGCEKRKKGKTFSTTTSTLSAPVTPLGGGKGKWKRFVSQGSRMIFTFIAVRRAIGRRSVLSSSPLKV